jgi:hypothetical protein
VKATTEDPDTPEARRVGRSGKTFQVRMEPRQEFKSEPNYG